MNLIKKALSFARKALKKGNGYKNYGTHWLAKRRNRITSTEIILH
jgi:hypothetical protein